MYETIFSGSPSNRGLSLKFWFFSRLVGESLIDFQCKVPKIMEAICFSLNDFDLVVYAFDFTRVDGVIAVVDNPISMALDHFSKGV